MQTPDLFPVKNEIDDEETQFMGFPNLYEAGFVNPEDFMSDAATHPDLHYF